MHTRKLPIEIQELQLRIENVPHYASDGLWVIPEQVKNVINKLKNSQLKYTHKTVVEYNAVMNSLYSMGSFNELGKANIEHSKLEIPLFIFTTIETDVNSKEFYLSENMYLIYVSEEERTKEESTALTYLTKFKGNINYIFI